MLCPDNVEEELSQNENKGDERSNKNKSKQVPAEGPGSLELSSYKNPKTWKKSITKFIRNQLHSSKSNEGDKPSGSNEHFEEEEISPEQKWQSLGKIFRRQSITNSWKSSDENAQKRSLGVKKVLSSYFGKNSKSPPIPDEN